MKKVLVVDDAQVNRDSIKDILVEWGFKVDLASSGEEAIEYVKNQPCDLIIMDHMMPGLTGIETTRLMKIIHPELNVIMMSFYDSEIMKPLAISAGAQGFLDKACDLKEFKKTLERVLGECIECISEEI